jgi:hypothetical protein
MEEMRRNDNIEISAFLDRRIGQTPSDEMDLKQEDLANLFLSQSPMRLSTRARFKFGTLRATSCYKFHKRDQSWTERFDDVEIKYSERDESNPRKRWFG